MSKKGTMPRPKGTLPFAEDWEETITILKLSGIRLDRIRIRKRKDGRFNPDTKEIYERMRKNHEQSD